MMKNLLRSGALLLALTLAPLATASAHDKHGRKHRHGRKAVKTRVVHVNHANPTPGIPRRVRRGRNWTPGVRRGPFTTTRTIIVPRKNRVGAAAALGGGHKRGHGRH